MAQLREDAKTGPFFMQVDFDAPHVPNDYESQDAAKFVGEQVPRVPSFDEQDVADKPRYIREDKPSLSQQTNPEVSLSCKDNETNSIEQNDCEYVRQLRDPPPTDTTAPTVVSTVPTATRVAPTTDVKATFSEDMDASSINGNTFKLFKKGSTTKIAAAAPNYGAATKTATLNPNRDLTSDVTYKAVVTTGVEDSVGNPLAQQYRWFLPVS